MRRRQWNKFIETVTQTLGILSCEPANAPWPGVFVFVPPKGFRKTMTSVSTLQLLQEATGYDWRYLSSDGNGMSPVLQASRPTGRYIEASVGFYDGRWVIILV